MIELALVMVIIAFVMAVASPRVITYVENDKVRTLNRRLTLDMAMARSEAIRTKSPVTISFDADGKFYQIDSMADINTLDGMKSQYRVDLVGKNGYDAKVVNVDIGGETTLTFDVFGRASADGEINIVSGDAEGTVTIERGKGVVQSKVEAAAAKAGELLN